MIFMMHSLLMDSPGQKHITSSFAQQRWAGRVLESRD